MPCCCICEQFHDLLPPLLSSCRAGRLSECEAQLAAVQQQVERAEAAAEGLPTAELERQVRCCALDGAQTVQLNATLLKCRPAQGCSRAGESHLRLRPTAPFALSLQLTMCRRMS